MKKPVSKFAFQVYNLQRYTVDGAAAKASKSKRQVAGRDYDN